MVFGKPLSRYLVAVGLSIVLGGCATASAIRDARQAEDRQDYDRAVFEYTRALQSDPDNIDARTGLARARLRASQDHFTRARRHSALGRLDEAVAEYRLASELNPDNKDILEEL